MKKLLLFMIGTMLAFSAYGQSKLPPCQGSDVTKWSNCFGTQTFGGGSKYVGEYKDGRKNGQGTLTFQNGEKYVGEWKDGIKSGQGTFTYADRDNYIGEWKDGKKNGQGTYIWANGDKYVGEFKNGVSRGRGVQSYADGRPSQEGIWADNQFVRAEKLNLPNQQIDLALNEKRSRLDEAQDTQSKLPPCPKVDYTKNTHSGIGGRTEKWHNCFGRYIFELNDSFKGSMTVIIQCEKLHG